MATVKLRRSELYDLPPVCTRCGAAASRVRVETLTWTPQWAQFTIFIGILPWFILVALTQQKATVHLPICEGHARKWSVIHAVVWAGLALSAALIGLGIYLNQNGAPELGEGVLGAGFVGLALSLMVLMFGSDGSARVKHITAETVTIDRVSPELAAAIESVATPSFEAPVTNRGGMELQTAKYYRSR
jgi:hypothetical protein